MADSLVTAGDIPANHAIWNSKVAAYLHALHDYQQYLTDVYQTAANAMDAELGPIASIDKRQALIEKFGINRIEAECNRYAQILYDARKALWLTPAPGPSQLMTKMEIAHTNEFWRLYDAEAIFEAMLKDVKALI